MLLNAYTGAFVNLISFFRTIIFSKKGTSKLLKTNYPLIITIILYILISIFTYDGLTSLFPLLASIVYAVVLWQDESKKIRFGSAFMFIMYFIYNIYVKAYVGAITEFSMFVSSVLAIIKIDYLDKS